MKIKKMIIIVTLITGTILLINSRRYSKSTFDFFVTMETNSTIEKCNKRLELGLDSKDIDIDHELYIPYYSHSKDICSLDFDAIRSIIEKYNRENLRDEYKFIW